MTYDWNYWSICCISRYISMSILRSPDDPRFWLDFCTACPLHQDPTCAVARPAVAVDPPRGRIRFGYRSPFIDKRFLDASQVVRNVSPYVIAAALLPAVVLAQAGTSAIAGVVRDSSGAAIPGATVKIVNEASGESIDAVTGRAGRVSGGRPASRSRTRVEAVLDGFRARRRSRRRSRRIKSPGLT